MIWISGLKNKLGINMVNSKIFADFLCEIKNGLGCENTKDMQAMYQRLFQRAVQDKSIDDLTKENLANMKVEAFSGYIEKKHDEMFKSQIGFLRSHCLTKIKKIELTEIKKPQRNFDYLVNFIFGLKQEIKDEIIRNINHEACKAQDDDYKDVVIDGFMRYITLLHK